MYCRRDDLVMQQSHSKEIRPPPPSHFVENTFCVGVMLLLTHNVQATLLMPFHCNVQRAHQIYLRHKIYILFVTHKLQVNHKLLQLNSYPVQYEDRTLINQNTQKLFAGYMFPIGGILIRMKEADVYLFQQITLVKTKFASFPL